MPVSGSPHHHRAVRMEIWAIAGVVATIASIFVAARPSQTNTPGATAAAVASPAKQLATPTGTEVGQQMADVSPSPSPSPDTGPLLESPPRPSRTIRSSAVDGRSDGAGSEKATPLRFTERPADARDDGKPPSSDPNFLTYSERPTQ